MLRQTDAYFRKTVTWISFGMLLLGKNLTASENHAWFPVKGFANWKPDITWGPESNRIQSRFASTSIYSNRDSTYHDNIFVSLGDSLYTSDNGGKDWMTIAHQNSYSRNKFIPLSIFYRSIVWGDLIKSQSQSEFNSRSYPNLPTALCMVDTQTIIQGNEMGMITRSSDGGRTWSTRFKSRVDAPIKTLLNSIGSWVFAVTNEKEVLLSRDDGMTWNNLAASMSIRNRNSNLTPLSADYLTMVPFRYVQTVWGLSRNLNGQPYIFKIPLDYSETAVTVVKQEIVGIPAASISTFTSSHDDQQVVPENDLLWIGTWGQGVFVSKDAGKTWIADNEGLKNLYIEDISVTSYGTAVVLTKEGIFRKDSGFDRMSGMVKKKNQRMRAGAGSGAGAGASIFRGSQVLGTQSGAKYTLDGREYLNR